MKSSAQRSFEGALRSVLTVSKDELLRREAQYRAERADKPKRGPKPKASASAPASCDKG